MSVIDPSLLCLPACLQLIAAAVSTQMSVLQAANPGRVVSVPPALVRECLDCLEEISTRSTQVGIGWLGQAGHGWLG